MKSLQWCQLFGFIIFTKHCYTTFIFYQVLGIIRRNSKRSKHSSVAGKANSQMKHSSREKREKLLFLFHVFCAHKKSHTVAVRVSAFIYPFSSHYPSLFSPILQSVKSSCVTWDLSYKQFWSAHFLNIPPEECFKCVISGPGGNNSSCEPHIDNVLRPGVFTVRSGSAGKHKERIVLEGHRIKKKKKRSQTLWRKNNFVVLKIYECSENNKCILTQSFNAHWGTVLGNLFRFIYTANISYCIYYWLFSNVLSKFNPLLPLRLH